MQDTALLSALGRQTFFDTFSGTCTEADMDQFLQDYFNPVQVQLELSNEQDLFYISEYAGTATGYIRMMEDYNNFPLIQQWKALELKRIYVSKQFHGTGVAQQLMAFAEDYAKGQHYQVLWLGVWEHNLRAQKFYRKCGFEDSGHTHDFPIGNTPQTDNWLWKFLQ